MISKELLQILRCPETQQTLEVAPSELVDRLNAAIESRSLRNKGGDTLDKAIEGALVRADRAVIYPVIDGIPIMLTDEAIAIDALTGG